MPLDQRSTTRFLSQSSRAVVVDDNSNDSTTTTTTTPFKYPSLMDEPSLFHDATAPKTPPRLDIPHSKQAHPALMTPPSTPSSSIRTTGSVSTDDAASVSTAATTVFDHEIEGPKSRFLLIGNVNRNVSQAALKELISSTLSPSTLRPIVLSSLSLSDSLSHLHLNGGSNAEGESLLNGLYVRHVESSGILILAFFNALYAQAARVFLSSRGGSTEATLEALVDRDDGEDRWLSSQLVTADMVMQLIGDSPFLQTANAGFYVTLNGAPSVSEEEPGAIDRELRKLLESYGSLMTFEKQEGSLYRAEYYDLRDTDPALSSVDGHFLFGKRLQIFSKNGTSRTVLPGAYAPAPELPGHSSSFPLRYEGPTEREMTPQGSIPIVQPLRSRSPAKSQPTSMDGQQQYSEYELPPPALGFNAASYGTQYYVGPSPHASQPFYAPDQQNGPPAPMVGHPYYQFSTPPPASMSMYPPPPNGPLYNAPGGYDYDNMTGQWMYEQNAGMHGAHTFIQMPPAEYWGPQYGMMPGMDMRAPSYPPSPVDRPSTDENNQHRQGGAVGPRMRQSPSTSPPSHQRSPLSPSSPSSSRPGGRRNTQYSILHATSSVATGMQPAPIPERNVLDLSTISDGLDTRTTVMIKNIPNKMSDRDLIEFIGKVVPRRIDFLYLRMDFQNACNVGYAFVNFIGVEDLLLFAQSRLGKKWNMYSSEKVLQMSYANYQGKEALVEKFKNSCVMDEREAWQPKIFLSEPGPDQGLPEPFPSPTHLKRKERSSYNRGNLFTHHSGNEENGHKKFERRGKKDATMDTMVAAFSGDRRKPGGARHH